MRSVSEVIYMKELKESKDLGFNGAHAVEQLVEAPCYRQKGHRFESR
jgi:hypothetical protein